MSGDDGSQEDGDVEVYVPAIPSARITGITNKGLVTVDFGVEMVIPRNISIVPIEVQIVAGDFSDPLQLKMSYSI